MGGSYVLRGGVGFCNAVRRTLVSDVTAEAPCRIDVHCNTTCQTDEFIAHRIGLIPFSRSGNGDTMTLDVSDRPAWSTDIVGCAFVPAAPHRVEVMRMAEGQRLHVTVHFDRRKASAHARYAMCAAVGMERIDGDGRHRITFETIDGSRPDAVLRAALDALDARVDDALRQLSEQDCHAAPRSYC